MLTEKQNLLETLKPGGKPDRLCVGYTAFKPIWDDPVFQFIRGDRVRGTDGYDRWGTFISFPEDQPGAIPIVTPQNQVVQDIEQWEKYVKVPDLVANCSEGWEAAKASKAAIDQNEYLTVSFMVTGIFEQLHMLMTFEDSLCNLSIYPDEMHALIDVITEYRLQYAKLIVENVHPDVIISHDDWGSENSLMMSPDTWREFFKEPYRKLYGYLHDNGVMVIHHSDSFLEPIVEDMAEIGIDVWQGVLPSNDIEKLSVQLGDRMALMGGISSVIDRVDSTEEEIRIEVRNRLNKYGHLPHFIPSMTYGGPTTLYPHVEPIVLDEIARWNKEHYGI